jgi:sugar phosphate permease
VRALPVLARDGAKMSERGLVGENRRCSPTASYRWVVLAAGTFGQAAYASILLGLAVVAPSLRARYGLGLTEVGVALAAPLFGSMTTLYPWGVVTDRIGERRVIGVGLGIAAGSLAIAAHVGSFAALVALLFVAGAGGAGVNSASGRAVLHWFDVRQRGFALGLRQTAVPIGGAWASFVLPSLVSRSDPRPALVAMALACLAGSVLGALALREGPQPDAAAAPRAGAPLRDRALWLLSAASALILAPQACLIGFLVLFLHGQRGLSTTSAGIVLGVVNLLGIATRIAAGSWSDLAGSRIRPLRRIALASAVLVACCTALASGPDALLLPVLVLTGCAAISWNGLSFAAAAEAAGHARSGSAIGMQQTALAVSGAVLPIAFGALVAATSWRAGFAAVALFALAGWRLLADLPG